MKKVLICLIAMLACCALFADDLEICLAAEKAHWVAANADIEVNGETEGQRTIKGSFIGCLLDIDVNDGKEIPIGTARFNNCRMVLDGKVYMIDGMYTFPNTYLDPTLPMEIVDVMVNGHHVTYTINSTNEYKMTPELSGKMEFAALQGCYRTPGTVDEMLEGYWVTGTTSYDITYSGTLIRMARIFKGNVGGTPVEISDITDITINPEVDGRPVSTEEFYKQMSTWSPE